MKKTPIALIVTAASLCTAGQLIGQESFAAREWSLSLYGSYVDKPNSDIGPGAGISYFLTRHLGVGAFTYFENWEGTFIDNMSLEGYFRWPLDRLHLAPYGLVAFGYSFETEESFGAIGAGAEWRISKWGVFGDLRWLVNDDTRDGVGVRIGARLVF